MFAKVGSDTRLAASPYGSTKLTLGSQLLPAEVRGFTQYLMPHYLSKTDFKVAQSCHTKLYYQKLGYPSTIDQDEEIKFLAQSADMLEAVAKQLFPDGQELGLERNILKAAQETMAALSAEKAVLFGAMLLSNHKLCRCDILVKDGNRFELIEVKGKAYNSQKNEQRVQLGANLFRSTKPGNPILSQWYSYIQEVTFQTSILQELFPEAEIEPFLMLPDKDKRTSPHLIHTLFVRRLEKPFSQFDKIHFDYIGDVQRLREAHILSKISIKSEVELLLPTVQEQAQHYLASLQPALRKIRTPIGLHCRRCQYRASPTDERDGFAGCWGALAEVTPHLFDMYRLNPWLADQQIQQEKVGLFDIDLAQLVTPKGKIGKDNERQRIQLTHSKSNSEWLSEELPDILASFRYPLHFIDFELSALPIPYHAGMPPYDKIAFQWSCHTLHEAEGELEHAEWINRVDELPNFRFAEALMQHLGSDGTIFAWGKVESDILRQILEQLTRYGYHHPTLKAWLEELTNPSNPLSQYHEPIVDMNRLTRHHYFHPLMKGKTGLKSVLDVIWQHNPSLRQRLPAYTKEENGHLLSPYQTLPPQLINGEPTVITNGAQAVSAYQAMLYGAGRHDPHIRQQWQQLLLQYCKLDTLAMVIVWWHWREKGVLRQAQEPGANEANEEK